MLKLNCDMGESFGAWSMGNDKAVMPYVDMANIACGFHAGDPQVMSQTVALAKAHHVLIGAHPAYPDLQGFGRRDMKLNFQEIINIVLYQVGALQAICKAQGAQVNYVKPHGALYNTMMKNKHVYEAILNAMSQLGHSLPLMIMATPEREEYQAMADHLSVPLLFEAFCDRTYMDEGKLQPRGEVGAVLESLPAIQAQVEQLINDQSVTTVSGKILAVNADTICVHGDGSLAVETVKMIRHLLSA